MDYHSSSERVTLHTPKILSLVTTMSLLAISVAFNPSEVRADDAGWNDRNRLAAEAWRAVDDAFYDRTFNGNDWFQLRQDLVKRNYKSDEEVYESIKSMLMKLGDKYTRYLPPAQYSAVINSALGDFTGVGVELQAKELDPSSQASGAAGVVVVNVQDGSPAREAGLLPGDRLVNVDGTAITDSMGPEEVAALLRGKEGTKASVRVLRDGEEKDFVAVRQQLRLKGVTWQRASVKGKRLGVITVRSFSSSTADDVSAALEDIDKAGAVDELVLDLRNNGGGLLQGGVQAANNFLPPGKIVVFVVSKGDKVEAERTLPGVLSNPSPLLPDLTTPLDVLVNRNTASAAEVLAAALKENGRARLVGEKTFGKGIIQNVRELQRGGVAVTVAKYETPLHNNINKIGIPVDVQLLCEPTDAAIKCVENMF